MNMKKALLLIATAMTALAMSAQTYDYFEFVDKDGNAIADGTTLTLTEVTPMEDYGTGEIINYMFANLSVRNKTAEEHSMRINMNITRIDNGSLQFCFPMACKYYDAAGQVTTEGGTMAANETRDLQTEWIPFAQGACDMTLKVEILNAIGNPLNPAYTYLADGPTVTLHYRNGIADDPKGDVDGNGIADISDMNIIINIILGQDSAESYGQRAFITEGDNQVDVADMNEIINILLGQ